jgi:hypothetical protein
LLRWLDLPAVVALAAERFPVTLLDAKPDDWPFPMAVARNLDWGERRLSIERTEAAPLR